MDANPGGLARFDRLCDLIAHELDRRAWTSGDLHREWVARDLPDPPSRQSVSHWRQDVTVPSPSRLHHLSVVLGWDDWTYAHACRLVAARDAA